MKNVQGLTLFLVMLLAACAGDSKKAEVALPSVGAVNQDSVNIAESLHSFYKWYGETGDQLSTTLNFVNTKGKHPQLDEAMMARYFAEFQKSGVVSAELVADETKFYRACAELWKKEAIGGRYSGLDIDRYYCQNDGDPAEFLTARVKFRKRGDRAKVAIMLSEIGPNHGAREFEMVKENGKWMLAKLRCNSGVQY